MPFEIEGPDVVALAQFIEDACIKLGNPSSIRVETGQYRYLQLFLAFDVGFVEACEKIFRDVKFCGS